MNELESNLKAMIIAKYGSIKKFCEIIDMPWTTLDSILKRGISNSNISNVLKITRELDINAEKLVDGEIGSVKSTIETIKTIDDVEIYSNDEKKHFKKYLRLIEFNRKKADDYVDQLLSIQQMEDDLIVKAAHERTDIEVTDEMRKHDDDLMDGDW